MIFTKREDGTLLQISRRGLLENIEFWISRLDNGLPLREGTGPILADDLRLMRAHLRSDSSDMGIPPQQEERVRIIVDSRDWTG